MQKVVNLPREDQAGQDIQYRTRSGRVVIPTQRLGLSPNQSNVCVNNVSHKGHKTMCVQKPLYIESQAFVVVQ